MRIKIKAINFIYKNTIMKSSMRAAWKILFVMFPLFAGLLSHTYLSKAFCKSLLLYSSALAFDMGWKCDDSLENGGWLFYTVSKLIFTTAMILTVFSGYGIYYNTQAMEFSQKYNVMPFVYLFIFLQIIWYGFEFVFLSIGEILKKNTSGKEVKTPIKVSHRTDSQYNI